MSAQPIVAATDGSEESLRAAEWAAREAALRGAPLRIVGTAEERAACTPDVFRLCSSEIPNVGLIISCMKAKKASLSQACRSVFDTPAYNKTAASE